MLNTMDAFLDILATFLVFFIFFLIVWYFMRLKGVSKTQINIKGNKIDRFVKNSEELISSNLNKIKKAAERSISKTYLVGCSWILVNNEEDESVLYTFRSNNELLITKNGLVKRFQYEIIIDNNSILITDNNITEHFEIVNIQDDFLFINKLSTTKILIFANQTKFKDVIKSEIRNKAKSYYKFNDELIY